MVAKKQYESLKCKVVRRQNEDVITSSVLEARDRFFISDETNWESVDSPITD